VALPSIVDEPAQRAVLTVDRLDGLRVDRVSVRVEEAR
jgi:hypothetical protein